MSVPVLEHGTTIVPSSNCRQMLQVSLLSVDPLCKDKPDCLTDCLMQTITVTCLSLASFAACVVKTDQHTKQGKFRHAAPSTL